MTNTEKIYNDLIIKKGKKQELKPVLYNQKSYYNKAYYKIMICDSDFILIDLFSYNMYVATLIFKDSYPSYSIRLSREVIEKKKVTATTKKHIRDFYYQFTSKLINTKEMKYISTF